MQNFDADLIEREETGIITDIQRFSVHDGPGIRTIVFFKGCPLRCKWCQNPETHTHFPDLMFEKEKCVRCGGCISQCPQKAIQISEDGEFEIATKKCIKCGRCCMVCYAKAHRLIGEEMTVEVVFQKISRDMVFYKNSGGGLTLSGGEVLSQPNFAIALLKRAKMEKLHTTVETSGYGKLDDLRGLVKYTDILLYDIKHIDPDKHKQFTGVENILIMENLRQVKSMDVHIIIRFPLIPNFNDDAKTIKQLGETLNQLDIKEIHILPFHQAGESKWLNLVGKDYFYYGVQGLSLEEVLPIRYLLESYNLKVSIGGGDL